jgi:hypothetical protein
MKRKVLLVTGLLIIIAVSVAFGAYAAPNIKLIINGKTINANVQVVNGSTYVPLRVVSETLGADVKWDAVKRTVTIVSKDSTGTNTTTPSTGTTPASAAKSFPVNVNIDSGSMKLNISKVTLDPSYKSDNYTPAIKAVVLDVTVENTSSDTVSWYPSQATIVTNTKEQIDADLFRSDQVSGDFIGKVVKKGKVVFEVKGDITAIDSISYTITGAVNSKTYEKLGEDTTTDIVLK